MSYFRAIIAGCRIVVKNFFISARWKGRLISCSVYIFMGANIDSVAEAGALGIRAEHAVNFEADSNGVKESFSRMSEAAKEARETGTVDGNWKAGQ